MRDISLFLHIPHYSESDEGLLPVFGVIIPKWSHLGKGGIANERIAWQ